ncbi:MAG: 50S ribosomal protein L28 [Phycisphaerae bacterium]
MSRVCHFTGKKTRAGRSIARRGKAKYLGGVGRKTTGITKRKFKPNIQRVRALVDGKVCRIRVSAKAIRMGLVIKPPRRTWRPDETSPSPTRASAHGHPVAPAESGPDASPAST